MKFVSFYDGEVFVNADRIYEIYTDGGKLEGEYYFEFLMRDIVPGDKHYEVFVKTKDWDILKKYVSNFWEDMADPKIVMIVPRL